MNDPREDGYVECDECGHALEQHDTEGCSVCRDSVCRDFGATCPTGGWTKKQIGDVRARYGLPRRIPFPFR